MSKEVVKDGALNSLEDLSQLIWRLAFTEVMPPVIKLVEEKLQSEEFSIKLMEILVDLTKAVVKVTTEDELTTLMPIILDGVNLGFIASEKNFNMYIKKAKQNDFKRNIYSSFVTSMFLMSIETIFKMQSAAPEEGNHEGEDSGSQFVLLEGGKSEEPTIPE